MSENALIVFEAKPPAEIFAENGLSPFIEKIKAEVAKLVPDISTEKGRKEIASTARKVASSKVVLDDFGKELVAGLKAQTSAIDAERKRMRDELDKLRDQVRAPLTAWEEKEEARQAAHRRVIEEMEALLSFQGEPSAADIQGRITVLGRLSERQWEEFETVASNAIFKISAELQSKHAQAKKIEEERAELARLQAAEQERLARERDERLQAEAAAKAKAEAEAEAQRAAEEAAAKAREEAEAAERERQAIEAERQAAVARAEKAEADRLAAEEKARADAIEAEARAKREAEAAVERERERAEAERRAADEAAAARAADIANRARVNNAALDALIAQCTGITPEIARAAVEAIARGKIPHITINY